LRSTPAENGCAESSGRRGRGFKSRHPDKSKDPPFFGGSFDLFGCFALGIWEERFGGRQADSDGSRHPDQQVWEIQARFPRGSRA